MPEPRTLGELSVYALHYDKYPGHAYTVPNMRMSMTLIFVLHGNCSETTTGIGNESTMTSKTKSDHANPWYII